jgi:hypothetical protein
VQLSQNYCTLTDYDQLEFVKSNWGDYLL